MNNCHRKHYFAIVILGIILSEVWHSTHIAIMVSGAFEDTTCDFVKIEFTGADFQMGRLLIHWGALLKE